MKFLTLRNFMCRYKSLVIVPGFFCFWLFVFELGYAAEDVVRLSSSNQQSPDLLLLKKYKKGIRVAGWLMSEKLDGVRAYWDGKHLVSRQGNVFHAPEWFIKNFPPFELDGELWLGRASFEETVSIVRRQQPHEGWNKLTYQIFEVPNQRGGLLERLKVLKDYLDDDSKSFIRIIPQTVVGSDEEVHERLQAVLDGGGEGLVLRYPDEPYQSGRSDFALKVKSKDDAECRVTGYTKGKGKYQGQVGALLCELMDGEFKALTESDDRIMRIGSGLSDAQRKDPPELGKVVTFRYSSLTKRGLPRFPVFWRVRKDWNENEVEESAE